MIKPSRELVHISAPTVSEGSTDNQPTNHYTAKDAFVQSGSPNVGNDTESPPLPLSCLSLFADKNAYAGNETNTAFATSPTAIHQHNEKSFFKYDHTPISFKDGHSCANNYEYAMSIVFDIDNSHSDAPEDWIYPDHIENQLEELGISYWICASRNHLLEKNGKAARPRFHVYLPLSKPLRDADKFVDYCNWCIRNFNADPNVNKKSQKIFGYGNNPEAFVRSWRHGCYIDDILTDDDLVAVVVPEVEKEQQSEPLPPSEIDYSKLGYYCGSVDFSALKQHLKNTGKTFDLARSLCGLSWGKVLSDKWRQQSCPICRPGCKTGDDRFYYRPENETFHCRKCEFNGDIFTLFGKVRNMSNAEAYKIIASAAGYPGSSHNPRIGRILVPPVPTIPDFPGENSGNGNSGNSGNNENVKNSGNGNSGNSGNNENVKNSGNGNSGNSGNNENVKNSGNGNSGNSGNNGNLKKYNIRQTKYMYQNDTGEECYHIIREDYTTDEAGECPTKSFRPVYQDANGNAVYREPTTLYPYRLPDILNEQCKRVFIVEGEKVVDSLRDLLVAAGCTDTVVTTSQGGSQRGRLWQDFLQRYLDIADKTIMILPDNDAVGMKYARTVAATFIEANPNADVQIISLPDLPDGGDFCEWYAKQKEIGNDDTTIVEILNSYCGNADYSEIVAPESILAQQTNDEAESVKCCWQPFPTETLPRQLGYVTAEISQSIGIDAANTAVCFLSVLSGLIGRTFQIEIKKSHREHAAIWAGLIAESGLGKSPALRFVQQPISRMQSEVRKKHEEEMNVYETALERYNDRKKKKGGEDYAKPKKPLPMQRYSVSDCTTEALLPILADNPYGVCLIRDELAAFFNGLDGYRKGKVDRQIYIELHGGLPVCADRKTGNQRYLAADTPSVSIIGGIQSDVIRRTVQGDPEFLTTGFGARFLLAYPPAEPIFWNFNEPDEAALLSYERLIDKILSYRQRFTAEKPGIITLTPDARELIFYFQHQQAQESIYISDGNVRYVLNKAGMHAARLCLVLHIIECAENDIDPLTPVSEGTMQQAIILAKWFLNEAYRIYAMFRCYETEMPTDNDEAAIIAKIERQGGEATIRQLKDGIRKYHTQGGSESLEQKLRDMVGAGRLSSRYEIAGNGRTVEYFSIPTVPTIPVPTIPTAATVPGILSISAVPTVPTIPVPTIFPGKN